MIWGKIKTYALIAGGAVLSVLVAAVTALTKQNSKLRARAENAEAKAKRAAIIAKSDYEIDEQTRSRRTDALKELDETGDSPVFRDPNSLWDDESDT